MEELGELFLAAIGQSSLEAGTWESGRDNKDNQDGGEDNVDAGAFLLESMRLPTPAPRKRVLV